MSTEEAAVVRHQIDEVFFLNELAVVLRNVVHVVAVGGKGFELIDL